MRREHFDVLRRALGDRGREVKNVGDGLMVVFPSASVAADVAVAMQQNVARTTTPTGEALGLRVGIAVGDAEADELDYFGRPVVEAARLCAQAGGGEIYATDVVRALAGWPRRSRVRLDRRADAEGSRRLRRGEPDPVVADPCVQDRVAGTARAGACGRRARSRQRARTDLLAPQGRERRQRPDRRRVGRAGHREDDAVRAGGPRCARQWCHRAVRTLRRGACGPVSTVERGLGWARGGSARSALDPQCAPRALAPASRPGRG